MIYKIKYSINAQGSVYVEASSRDAAEAVARADVHKLVDGALIIDNDIDISAVVDMVDMPSLDELVRDGGRS